MPKIILKFKNPYTGKMRSAPLGFSCTTFFFSFLVPLIRKDWYMAGIMFIYYLPTLGLSSILFAFVYNKIYAKSLFEKGYNLIYFWGDLTKSDLNDLKFN